MVYKIIKERHEQTIEVCNKEFNFENKEYKGASFKLTLQNRNINLKY